MMVANGIGATGVHPIASRTQASNTCCLADIDGEKNGTARRRSGQPSLRADGLDSFGRELEVGELEPGHDALLGGCLGLFSQSWKNPQSYDKHGA